MPTTPKAHPHTHLRTQRFNQHIMQVIVTNKNKMSKKKWLRIAKHETTTEMFEIIQQ